MEAWLPPMNASQATDKGGEKQQHRQHQEPTISKARLDENKQTMKHFKSVYFLQGLTAYAQRRIYK